MPAVPGSVLSLHVAPGSRLPMETLAEAELRRRHGITVLGFHRPSTAGPGARRFEVATADYRIVEGDVLLFVGETRSIQDFVTAMGE